MNGRSRWIWSVLVASAVASALAPVASAQETPAVPQHRENQVRDQQEFRGGRSRPAPGPAVQAQQPAPSPRLGPPRGMDNGNRPPPSVQGGNPSAGAPQIAPNRGGGGDFRGYDRGGRDGRDGRDARDGRGGRDGNAFPPRGNAGRYSPPRNGYQVRRPPRIAPALPPAYRSYSWGGSNYYWGGGRWYRPYGSSYVVVGAPLGMFMPYLPGSYSTVWVGGSRFYYADGSYFSYEPMRRGYVVVRSPYRDDDEYYDDAGDDRGSGGDDRDNDLYIYPMRGQNEQQQSDDRYQCHRWAVDQTHYDPTDSEYDRDDRSEYDRAISACLTGRGYSVK